MGLFTIAFASVVIVVDLSIVAVAIAFVFAASFIAAVEDSSIAVVVQVEPSFVVVALAYHLLVDLISAFAAITSIVTCVAFKPFVMDQSDFSLPCKANDVYRTKC